MSFDNDIRKMEAAGDAAARQWHEDAEWLHDEVRAFNDLDGEAAETLLDRGVDPLPVATEQTRFFGGFRAAATGKHVWEGQRCHGIVIAVDGLYGGEFKTDSRGGFRSPGLSKGERTSS